MNDDRFSVYIHLPFCKSRCVYCDFFSTVNEKIPFAAYRTALISEWRRRRAAFQHLRRTLTVYIGGGTPSLWPADELKPLLEEFDLRDCEEVTVEANPKDTDEIWFRDLVRCGVNRFSIGVQSMDDERLSFLARRHSVKDSVRCVSAALSSGARSVSADLIFGTFGHTPSKWQKELESIINLGVHHVSAYELTVADGTPLALLRAEGERVSASESALLRLYRSGLREFRKHGFSQYEVSNFARKGHRSLHNSQYWKGGEYIGLGAGAHGFVKLDGHLIRYGNTENVDDYLIAAAESDSPIEEGVGRSAFAEQVSTTDHARELMMLGLRTSDGAEFDEIVSALPLEVADKWRSIASSFKDEKLVRLSLGKMIPTAACLIRADGIAEKFF